MLLKTNNMEINLNNGNINLDKDSNYIGVI